MDDIILWSTVEAVALSAQFIGLRRLRKPSLGAGEMQVGLLTQSSKVENLRAVIGAACTWRLLPCPFDELAAETGDVLVGSY